jgi:spermidine/putrescine-binding protein
MPRPLSLLRTDSTVPDPRLPRPRPAPTDHLFGRRRFLRVGAGIGVALVAPWTRAAAQGTGPAASGALPSGSPVPPGQLRLLTSPDHWDPAVLLSLAAHQGIDVRITPLTDDAAAFAAVSSGAVDTDMVSGDGLWIPAYHAAGSTEPIDLAEISVAAELYSVARTMELLETPDGMLGYPWSWSPLQVVYDPARVANAPDSWDVLVDPASRGRVVIEEQRMDLVLCAGRATGARDPLDMTDAELAAATDWLTRLKPNIRRITRHRGDTIAALTSGECTMAISSLGAPDLVKDAGGPEMVAFVPKEGTIGSIEAEMVRTNAPNAVRVPAYLDAAASAEASAAAFLHDGRPLFNERAYRLLVDAGQGARADRYLYDRPEFALEMTLTGPGARPDAYLAAAQVVFGDQ